MDTVGSSYDVSMTPYWSGLSARVLVENIDSNYQRVDDPDVYVVPATLMPVEFYGDNTSMSRIAHVFSDADGPMCVMVKRGAGQSTDLQVWVPAPAQAGGSFGFELFDGEFTSWGLAWRPWSQNAPQYDQHLPLQTYQGLGLDATMTGGAAVAPPPPLSETLAAATAEAIAANTGSRAFEIWAAYPQSVRDAILAVETPLPSEPTQEQSGASGSTMMVGVALGAGLAIALGGPKGG